MRNNGRRHASDPNEEEERVQPGILTGWGTSGLRDPGPTIHGKQARQTSPRGVTTLQELLGARRAGLHSGWGENRPTREAVPEWRLPDADLLGFSCGSSRSPQTTDIRDGRRELADGRLDRTGAGLRRSSWGVEIGTRRPKRAVGSAGQRGACAPGRALSSGGLFLPEPGVRLLLPVPDDASYAASLRAGAGRPRRHAHGQPVVLPANTPFGIQSQRTRECNPRSRSPARVPSGRSLSLGVRSQSGNRCRRAWQIGLGIRRRPNTQSCVQRNVRTRERRLPGGQPVSSCPSSHCFAGGSTNAEISRQQ